MEGDLRYKPALDGLRAFAVLGVICAHTKLILPGGGRGVDVFFVLSGYLITTILMREPPLRDFYIRRVRRLLPALALFLAAYLLLAPFILPRDNPWREAILSLLYTMNWSLAFDYRSSGVAHTWSLSIEEQFYLLWPIVLIGLRKTSIPLWWLAAGWLVFTVLRITWPDARASYYITPFHATGLIVGAMAALRLPDPRFGWLALIALLLSYVLPPLPGWGWGRALTIPVVEIATVFLISALLQPSKLTAMFSWPPLVWIGLVSYGIYLWHLPFAQLTRDDYWWSLPFTLVGSIALAAISYYAVEVRFRHGPLTSREGGGGNSEPGIRSIAGNA
jgi:peptidoglycan/LPS O-acetylase OafA/YrhL